jgi:hypothetical protein
MIRKRCARRYGHIESLIQDFNESVVCLNSYLSDKKISEIRSDTTIKGVLEIIKQLNGKDKLMLEDKICISYGAIANNIAESIKYSACNDKCYDIDCAWRAARDTCEELKKTIDDFSEAVNALGGEAIINENTFMRQIMRICNDNDCYPYNNNMDSKMLKNILKDTVDVSYKSSHKMKYCGIVLLIVVLVILLLAFCSCTNKKSDKELGGRITVSLFNDSGKTEFEYCLCDSVVFSVEKNDSISIERDDTLCGTTSIHVYLMNEWTTIKDTIICLNNKYGYKVNDSTFNKIVIAKAQRCDSSVLEIVIKDNNSSFNVALPLIKYGFILVSLIILIFFFARPIINKAIDNENKENEKVLDEKIRVQNEWQQILQEKYRLENRRVEIDLNAVERDSKAKVEECYKQKEHLRRIEIKRMDIELEKFKNSNSTRTAESQMLDKRLRDFNEQIVKLMSNIKK